MRPAVRRFDSVGAPRHSRPRPQRKRGVLFHLPDGVGLLRSRTARAGVALGEHPNDDRPSRGPGTELHGAEHGGHCFVPPLPCRVRACL